MKRLMGLALVVAVGAASGCGSGGVQVDGKVVDGGKPYSPAEGDTLTISIKSDDGHTGTASVEKDGTFKVKSPTGEHIPPGKYKVSVVNYQTPKTAPGSTKTPPPPKTPMPIETGEVWDISSSNKSFTLDISKAKTTGAGKK